MPITQKLAMVAGADEANRNMRAAGRTTWSEEDYNIAAATARKLLGLGAE